MTNGGNRIRFCSLNDRQLTIAVFSLFFSWMLSMPFEGPLLYTVSAHYGYNPVSVVIPAIVAQLAGLFLSGLLIKTMHTAKHLFLFSISWCLLVTTVFFFPPDILWDIALVSGSFLAGMCVAAWGLYYRNFTPSVQRINTAAKSLIFSNIYMILLNMAAVLIAPWAGLSLSLLLLVLALGFAIRLPVGAARPKSHYINPSDPESSRILHEPTASTEPAGDIPDDPGQTGDPTYDSQKRKVRERNIRTPFLSLCLFIFIITINSGLMYRVIAPAFSHLQWLVSWYWVIPYIMAIVIAAILPRKGSRFYVLYIGLAMTGFSFIAFMIMDRSAGSYLVIDTLLLGACGFFDLFWWSMIGEMLDFSRNPVKTLGWGLSANVLGILSGELIGGAMNLGAGHYPSILAFAVLFVCLVILPMVDKQLSTILKGYDQLTALMRMPAAGQKQEQKSVAVKDLETETETDSEPESRFLPANVPLTGRESEITGLLLKGMTYKMIAAELHLSENTVKTHIKNIYTKFNVQSRIELVTLLHEKERSAI